MSQTASTNPIERINYESKQRTEVARIFMRPPSPALWTLPSGDPARACRQLIPDTMQTMVTAARNVLASLSYTGCDSPVLLEFAEEAFDEIALAI